LLQLPRQTHEGTVLATRELPVRAEARSAATVPVPAALAAAEDPAREVLVVAADGRPERTVHFFAEDRDSALAGGVLSAGAARTGEGIEITLTASATVRDVCVRADKVDPGAVADRQLVTLLAGEQATLRVRTAASVDPEAFLAENVLISANDLVARAADRAGDQIGAGAG